MKKSVRDVIAAEIESLELRIGIDGHQLKSLRDGTERLEARMAQMKALRDELKAELPESVEADAV